MLKVESEVMKSHRDKENQNCTAHVQRLMLAMVVEERTCEWVVKINASSWLIRRSSMMDAGKHERQRRERAKTFLITPIDPGGLKGDSAAAFRNLGTCYSSACSSLSNPLLLILLFAPKSAACTSYMLSRIDPPSSTKTLPRAYLDTTTLHDNTLLRVIAVASVLNLPYHLFDSAGQEKKRGNDKAVV